MAKKIDMTGWIMKEHGVPESRLTVIKEDLEYPKLNHIKSRIIYWKCQCECGNIITVSGPNLRQGNVLSCKCLQQQRRRETHLIDMTNWVMKEHGVPLSRLTVIRIATTEDYKMCKSFANQNHVHWLCQCECGNYIIVEPSDLKRGTTISCGCARSDINGANLIGQRFGKLTVTQLITDLALSSKKRNRYWLCKCDCGGEKITTTTLLTTGHVSSCGCLVSKGEEKIAQILRNNNIPFIQQKIFKDLNTGPKGHLRYDFYINNDFLLEFDGTQHFYETPIGWNQSLQDQKIKDQLKNDYAKLHHIPLKRIPYWDFDKITLENIMSDKWLVKD